MKMLLCHSEPCPEINSGSISESQKGMLKQVQHDICYFRSNPSCQFAIDATEDENAVAPKMVFIIPAQAGIPLG